MRIALLIALLLLPPLARAEDKPQQIEDFSKSSVVVSAAKYLGATAESMAEAMDTIFNRYGAPDAIIRGEEGGGALVIGLRYGRGTLQFQSGATYPIYWRGPSAGIDAGGAAAKSFTLIYGSKDPDELYKRFFGIDGTAIVVGGVAFNYLQRDNIVVVPIRAGVGVRLGLNVNYLKFTRKSGWFPF